VELKRGKKMNRKDYEEKMKRKRLRGRDKEEEKAAPWHHGYIYHSLSLCTSLSPSFSLYNSAPLTTRAENSDT